MINDEISIQTAQERKKRRKELIRLYKLRKTSNLDKKSIGQKELDVSGNKSRTMNKQVDLMIASENIMDSRAVDERLYVNETLEKRKLITYNNPSMVAKTTMTKLQIPDRGQEDSDGANANVGSKRSAKAIQPPFSIIKKEACFISSGSQNKADGKLTSSLYGADKQAGKSTADESSG